VIFIALLLLSAPITARCAKKLLISGADTEPAQPIDQHGKHLAGDLIGSRLLVAAAPSMVMVVS